MEQSLLLLIVVVIVFAVFVLSRLKVGRRSSAQQIEESSIKRDSATEFELHDDYDIAETQWSRLEREAKAEYCNRKEELKALEKSIGITEQICPNCQATLAKMPKRKSKCKSCGEPVFPRTLPNDDEPRLYNEATRPLFEEVCAYQTDEWIQWRTYRLHDELTCKKHDAIRLTLAEEWNVLPTTISEGDITWREHHYALDKAIEKGDNFGAYLANEKLLKQLNGEVKYDKMFPIISQCLFFHYRAWDGGADLSPVLRQIIATAMKALCLNEVEVMQKIDANLAKSLSDANTRNVIYSQLREDIKHLIEFNDLGK
jgi:hypothetical protein